MSTVLRAGEREYRERLRKKDLEIAEQLDKVEVRIGRNKNYSECRKSSVVQNHTKKVLGRNLDHLYCTFISFCHVVPRCNKCDIAPFTYIFPPLGMHLVDFMLSCIFNVSDYNTM